MPHATLNGNRAHYETYGQGDPLLLVSGLGGPARAHVARARSRA